MQTPIAIIGASKGQRGMRAAQTKLSEKAERVVIRIEVWAEAVLRSITLTYSDASQDQFGDKRLQVSARYARHFVF